MPVIEVVMLIHLRKHSHVVPILLFLKNKERKTDLYKLNF